MAIDTKRRRRAYEIMKGNAYDLVKSNDSEKNRKANAYAIMNQNTRDQRAKEQAKIEKQQDLNNLSNLACRAAMAGFKTTTEQRKKTDAIEKRRNNNDEGSAYLTLKMAEANSGKVPVNYISNLKTSHVDPAWSVGDADKIDFSNSDSWIYDSGETLDNFTPLNEAERKRYLEVTKIDYTSLASKMSNMTEDEFRKFKPSNKKEAKAYYAVARIERRDDPISQDKAKLYADRYDIKEKDIVVYDDEKAWNEEGWVQMRNGLSYEEILEELDDTDDDSRKARTRALVYAYQSGDITENEKTELSALLVKGTKNDANDKINKAINNNTLSLFEPENMEEARQYLDIAKTNQDTTGTADERVAERLNLKKRALEYAIQYSVATDAEKTEYMKVCNELSIVQDTLKENIQPTTESDAVDYTDNAYKVETQTIATTRPVFDEKVEAHLKQLEEQLKSDEVSIAEKANITREIDELLNPKETIEQYDESKVIPTYVDGEINDKLPEEIQLEVEASDYADTHDSRSVSTKAFWNSVGLGLEEAIFGLGKFVEAVGDITNLWEWDVGDDWFDEEMTYRANKAKAYYKAAGATDSEAEMANLIVSSVAQVLPQVVISFATSGGSSLSGAATAATSGSTLSKAFNSLKTMVKNPMFAYTYATEFADTYQDAKIEGASKATAVSAASISGFVNSIVEMGGIESGEQSILKAAWGEGKEEILQGLSSNIIAKAMYAPDMPLISTDGSDAVFNVKELTLSFLGGMVGGAAGGGMIKGVNYISNTVTNAQQAKVYGDELKTNTEVLSQYAQYALENGSKSDVKTANEILSAIQNQTLNEIPSVKVGRFAQNAAKIYQNKYIAAIAQEESGASIKEKTKSASEIYNTLQNIYTNPEFILNDTRATMIRSNKVAAEALSRSAGLNSTINAETPVSTVKTIARMVSNGVNVNNNQSINVDSTGRVSSTVTPTQIDVEAAQRIKNGNGSLSDYLSVTGKTLDDYRGSEGEVDVNVIRREAHEIIDNSEVLTNTGNNRLTEILNSRRLLNSNGENDISVNNISGLERVAPQNIVEIRDGKITLDNGRTVSAESVPFTDDARALYTASARYKDNTKAIFISGFEGGNLNNYIKNFSNVYDMYAMEAKLTDEERYKSVNAFKQILGENVFNAARQAGIEARNERKAAKTRQNEQKATERKKKNEGKNKSSQKGSESERKYSIKNPTYTQDDLKNNAITVRNMESVKNLKGNEFDGDGKLTDRIDSYFAKLGNNVYSEELGDIALSKTSRRSDLRHGTTRKKVSSYIAIPEVIQEGKVVAVIPKELSERIIVAAPITINNEPYYMGVMLQRDGQNQRLYLHDVITEKETAISAEDNLITTRSSANNDSLYMTSILRKALNVNNSISEKAGNDTKKDLSQNKNTVNDSMYEDSEIRLSEKEKNTTIIEQLKQAKDKLDKMSPVIKVNENREFKNNIDKINYAVESFEKFNYQVHREDIGKVVIDKKRAKRALGYLSDNQEILAFKAVPNVIESGIVIDTRANHKGRQYATVTVAAPIMLNGNRASVAVVISKTTDNFYKVHRVLFPDNSSLEFLDNKKTGFKTIGATLNNNSAHAQSGNPVNNSISQNKNTVNDSMYEDSEIRLSEKEKNTTIIEQLKQSKDKLDKMSPVIEVNENREFKTNIEKIEFFEKILHEQGDKIYRQGFGEVVIGKNQYKKALAYLKTHDEIISFAAVPKVIETGVKIGEHLNHKDRGYSTTTFGAKIRLNGQSASIAVVVKQTNKNYYKVHRVLMSDDSVLEFIDNKKEELETARVAREKTRVLSKPTNSSTNSIPQNKNTVNDSMSEKASKKGVITESYKEEWVLDRKDKATELVIKQIAYEYAKRGINVEIAYVKNGHNGQWNPKTNTVIVNLAANNPIETFLHEATGHVIHDYANENWQDIKNAAFTYLASIEDVSIADIRNHKIDQYKKNKLSYTEELIDEEIVSDMIGVMAQDKNSVQKLYNSLIQNGTEETLAQRIVRKLKELLMKLKLHFLKLNGKYNSAISKLAKQNRPSDNAFSEYLDKINSILSQSFEHLQVTEDSEVRFSVKESEKYTFDTAHNSFTAYKADTKNNLKLRNIEIVDNENQLENIISNALDNRQSKNNYCLGAISEDLLQKIKAEVGENIFKAGQYSFIISSDDIRHIQDHFKDTKDIKQAIFRLCDTVNNYDTVKLDKQGNRNLLVFEKSYDDYNYLSVELASKKNRSIDLVTFYVTLNNKKRVLLNSSAENNSATRGEYNSSNNNISQNDAVVNNSISENGESDTKFSLEEDFTYDELIKKPDIKVVEIKNTLGSDPTRADVKNEALKNAKSIGKTNDKGETSVYVSDIGKKVVINRAGIEHSLNRRYKPRSNIIANVGNILTNSIEINRLKTRNENTNKFSRVLLGVAEFENNIYIVKSTVDVRTSRLDEIEVLYGVSSKQKRSGVQNTPGVLMLPTTSKISVSQLLDIVKDDYRHLLSADVLDHFNLDRDYSTDKGIANDLLYSLKEDVDKIQGVAYNNTKTLREHNEYDDFMPSGAMGKEIRNKIIQSFANKNFGNEAAVVDFYFGDYRMTVSYVSPTDYKLIDFYEIENERDGNIYAEYNGKGNDSHLQGQGNGSVDSTNDSRLSQNRGTAKEDAQVSQSQSERNGGGYSGRTDVHNGETETTFSEDSIKKYSLLDDVEIEKAKKAYERNRKLQADTKLVRKLFKDAGTVLDKSKTYAIADTLAKRYEVKDAKLKSLLKDKLNAYYTYVASEDATDAQIALYGHEIAQDIAAMSEEITENPSGNFFEEYGESIYDVISLDIAREYAEKAIIKAPKDLEQEHKEIADEYRKLKDSGGDTKAIYKELKDKTDELVKARKQYAKSRSEVMELRELLRKTQKAYERKIEKRGASRKVVSQTSKVVDKDGKSGIIRVGEVSDFNEMKSYMSQKYNISIDSSVCELDFETCQKSLNGFEAVCGEYPELSNKVQKIKITHDGVMSCTGDTINFNPEYFKSSKDLDEICKEQSKKGFWIRNASPDSLMVHESGHAVESLLIEANPNYAYDFQRTIAWQECTEAKNIISKAVKEIKETEYGKGKKKIDLISAISRYALRDDSEALAEAFADVYANGDNANILSLKIKEITKAQFEQYRKGGSL